MKIKTLATQTRHLSVTFLDKVKVILLVKKSLNDICVYISKNVVQPLN